MCNYNKKGCDLMVTITNGTELFIEKNISSFFFVLILEYRFFCILFLKKYNNFN